jgi:hypothetical protein
MTMPSTKKTKKPASADGGAKTKAPKAARAPKAHEPKAPSKAKRVSALDAAAHVLAGASKPMSAGDLIQEMEAKKLWTSPGGKTPAATLSAAIGREIKDKGKEARFKKAERGLFEAGPSKAD